MITRQEAELFFNPLENVEQINEHTMDVTYTVAPDTDFEGDAKELIPPRTKKEGKQRSLF